jgi:hypothetical protein
MKTNFDIVLTYFIYFIIFIKIIFALSSLGDFILTHTHSQNNIFKYNLDVKFLYWKIRTEFIFIASMAILLIYYFMPGYNKPISKESSLLFYLFGWILLFTSNWTLFFEEADWYKAFSKSLT